MNDIFISTYLNHRLYELLNLTSVQYAQCSNGPEILLCVQ